MTSSQHSPGRYVAMKDSWSHGDDRRERGRVVDRGVARQRRSRSPVSRRVDNDREPKDRDRNSHSGRPYDHRADRPRERSRERESRRRSSRSPIRDTREEVRNRNRGRELLDTRGSDKPRRSHRSHSSSKRRKTRSPSPVRSHHKKSKREISRSPSRQGGRSSSSRADRKRHTHTPLSRKRSSERTSDNRVEDIPKLHRDSRHTEKRDRSQSPRYDKTGSARRHSPTDINRNRSPHHHHRHPRDRSASERSKAKDRGRDLSPGLSSRRSPGFDRYELSRTRDHSPSAPRGPKSSRVHSPKGDRSDRASKDDYQSAKAKNKGVKPFQPTTSGANRIEVAGARRSSLTAGGPPSASSGANTIEIKTSRRSSPSPGGASRAPSGTASGANSIEVKSEKMAGRGYYTNQHGYNPNQQMQAAFPLKQHYNQAPQSDPRQYSQSPQHHTPNSYHGSPQAHSPYSAGRGNWGSQQQYSPQPQYPQSYQQQSSYSTPNHNQGHYYNNQSQSPPYQAPTGPMNQGYPQTNFRGSQRGFRGNHFHPRGGRGDHRGGRGGNHFQNTQWNSGSGPTGIGRGQHNGSGNVTPQNASPPQQQQQYSPHPSTNNGTPKYTEPQPPPPQEDEEDGENLFRPSKELQVEDKEDAKKKDEEKMPPPSRPTPTGPQSQQNSSKFSFAFKASSKATPTTPKPEISQKLSAAPVRREILSPEKPRGLVGQKGIPTEPASARRPNFHEPPPPTTRKVKKIMKRLKPRPQLEEEFKASDSVYYRKPGNESVVGSGTYGKVFKAVHVYTKNLVALKKIRMEGERDGFPVTAVREIKLLQSLKHKNIVNLEEVMVEKNDCFMVFEYLSHDLTGLLNHPTFKLEPSHKKHLAKQLFEGLDYLHRRGVLHRDIKAANILVSSDGILKLADFGLARFYAKRRQLDYTNRVITIWYRSPELLLGETQYGPAVDIWSAACVLVEIFTRHAIFPGDGGEISQLEKIYAVLGTPNKVDWPGLVDMAWFELLRPSARRPNVFAEKYKERVTPAAFELLEAMFQYDPAKRPSASDVLEHPYFSVEEPKPKQAVELAAIEGDWHEFESKALRKENERKDKEARRQAQKDAAIKADRDKKRGPEGDDSEREAKRVQTGQKLPEEVS